MADLLYNHPWIPYLQKFLRQRILLQYLWKKTKPRIKLCNKPVGNNANQDVGWLLLIAKPIKNTSFVLNFPSEVGSVKLQMPLDMTIDNQAVQWSKWIFRFYH